jgi:uncharacterized protein (TIGR02001 family)
MACAQVSGSAIVASDYRYRGITLSDRKPAAQAGVSYDDPLGWFVGAFGSTVRLAAPTGPAWQTMVFAGYASRISPDVSVEAGGDYSAFTGASGDNYGEVYVGAANENMSARIHYSPSYFGQAANSIYGEINATQPLVDRVGIFMHVGLTHTRADYAYGSRSTQNVVDGRVGIGANFEWLRLELAWVGISNKSAAERITGSTSPNTVVLTLSHSF